MKVPHDLFVSTRLTSSRDQVTFENVDDPSLHGKQLNYEVALYANGVDSLETV